MTTRISGGLHSHYVTTLHGEIMAAVNSSSKAHKQELTVDEANVSPEARKMYEEAVKKHAERMARTGSDMTRHIDFEKEDLTDVKSKLEALKESSLLITNRIDAILKEKGIKITGSAKLKIEIDANGKIMVGGIQDGKKVRDIEKALNNDKDLVKTLKAHRDQEYQLNGELQSITGMSMVDFKNRLSEVASDKMMASIPIKTTKGETFSKEEMLAFKDQNLYWVDPEFMDEIGSYIQSNAQYDFAVGNDMLSDPAAGMEKVIKDTVKEIREVFEAEKNSVKDKFNPKTAEDERLLDRTLKSLDRVSITVDAGGNVQVDGVVSDLPRNDAEGKDMIMKMFRQALADNPLTGEQNNFKIMAERLKQDSGGNVVTAFRNGVVTTKILPL